MGYYDTASSFAANRDNEERRKQMLANNVMQNGRQSPNQQTPTLAAPKSYRPIPTVENRNQPPALSSAISGAAGGMGNFVKNAYASSAQSAADLFLGQGGQEAIARGGNALNSAGKSVVDSAKQLGMGILGTVNQLGANAYNADGGNYGVIAKPFIKANNVVSEGFRRLGGMASDVANSAGGVIGTGLYDSMNKPVALQSAPQQTLSQAKPAAPNQIAATTTPATSPTTNPASQTQAPAATVAPIATQNQPAPSSAPPAQTTATQPAPKMQDGFVPPTVKEVDLKPRGGETREGILSNPDKLAALNMALATLNDPNASKFDVARANNIIFMYDNQLRTPEQTTQPSKGYEVGLGDKNGGTMTFGDKAAADRVAAGIAARGGLSSPPPTQSAAAQAAGTTDFWVNNGLPGGAAQYKAERQQAAQQQQMAQLGKLALQGNKEAIAVIQGLAGLYQSQNQQGLQRDAMNNEMAQKNMEANKPANQLANQLAYAQSMAGQNDPAAKAWLKEYNDRNSSAKDNMLEGKYAKRVYNDKTGGVDSEEMPVWFNPKTGKQISYRPEQEQANQNPDHANAQKAQAILADPNADPNKRTLAEKFMAEYNAAYNQQGA